MQATDITFLRKTLLAVTVVAAVVLMLLFFAFALDIVLLVMCGTLAAITLNRLTGLLCQMTRLPYRWSFTITLLLVVAIIGSLAFVIGDQIVQHAFELLSQLSTSFKEFFVQVQEQPWGKWLLRQMPSLMSPVPGEPLADKIGEGSLPGAKEVVEQVTGSNGMMSAVGSFFSLTGGTLLGLVIVIFLAIYLAFDPQTYRRGAAKLVPINQRERFLGVLSQIGQTLWWWVLGRLIGMLIIGTLSTLGLYLIGVPMALPLGVMAGLLNFIPNIGPTLALVPPLLFGLQQGYTTAVYVFCWYLGLQFIETYVISPLIEQRQVYLPPGVTIPVQVLLGVAAGIFGVAMATPLAAVVMVLVREYYVKDTLGDHSEGLADMPGVPRD